jgi:hypothetical protein
VTFSRHVDRSVQRAGLRYLWVCNRPTSPDRVILIVVLIVLSGLALWKPVQFSEFASLFYDFQTTRLIHFLCMTAIVLFLVVHVAPASLVPQNLYGRG